MKLPPSFRPKRPRWFVATTAIAAGAIVLGAGVRWWRGWSAGDAWGLAFGILAAFLMLLGALYPLRRRLMIAPLRTAQDWLQLHVYGSTLAAVFVLVHMGLRLPGGGFGWSRETTPCLTVITRQPSIFRSTSSCSAPAFGRSPSRIGRGRPYWSTTR